MTLTTRLALAMILVVAAAVSAVGLLGYHNLEQALLPRILDRIESHSKLVASDLRSYVRGARADVATFSTRTAVQGMVTAHVNGGTDPVDHVAESTWRGRLIGQLAAELEAKPAYSQFRLIGLDDGGRELVRVDRSGPNGAVRVVPDGELQRKGDRAYFKETIKLKPDEVYVSPVDLNQENGTIEVPHVPTLRVATPIFAPGGKLFGIVVINVDMRPCLERIRTPARPGEQIYVVDAKGDYLVHPEPSREFASDLGGRRDWQKDFPYFASLVGGSQSGVRVIPDSSRRPGGAALAPAMLVDKQWIGIIETVPNAVFVATATAISRTSLQVGLIAMLGAAALAFAIARSLTRPINRLRAAVEGIGRDEPFKVPPDASGETAVLAQAFARAMNEVKAKTAELEREVQEHRRTEAARDHYAARDRLFSAMVESSNDAIVTKSLDGIITGWNPAAERLFGYSAEEAVGQSINLIVPPDRGEEVQAILRRILRGERIEHHETMRRRKDGTLVQVSLSISPIRNAAGEIIGASKIARDITELRQTELALRQQLEERERIFENSQDLILVMDAGGALVQVSPSCETILGFRPEEMIGHSSAEFIHPDDLAMTQAEMGAARRGDRSKISDTRMIHKDGRAVTLSWLGTWSEPVKRYFFVGRDTTESRLAQESLRESEQLARNIIETALDAFVQIDENGSILNWNSQAEQIFGWSRDAVLGKDLIQLVVVEADHDELREALSRFRTLGHGQILGPRREITVRRRDGKELTAELSLTATKTRTGFVFNGFFRDLTEKIAAEERIRQSEKMEAIGQLTGGIAHDFNNILTVITGTIEILGAAVAKEPQLAAITKMIDEAAARGADLTQHLLAFARRQPLQPREIDINTLIIDTAKLLRPTLGEHIEIESVFEDEACIALVDPNQLATAILNLALNARDAMPGGGKLILETASIYLDEAYARVNDVRPGRYSMIAVSDTGTGIPAAILDRVFDPFFTSKGPGKGTGLGLSMVYGFIKQSAGHIKIYSEEGVGTTIKMYLPPGTGASLAPESHAAPEIEGGHETILVVEDDRLVRDYVLTQLHSLGYVTLDAANASEALSLVDQGHKFDLLFTDVIMPGLMNGRQLADHLQKHLPDLKVLFTSGYTENAIIHHGRLDSGVLLLAKPYRKSDMARMIRRALEG
ncbi:PAS domain S-box protein [Bradyrhizobium sp. STM 3562]|uniref:PAS domain S-box protein n=1 Tax=Bradyrhizobium sp. STM 3562 TaxID=578924 RepID=UPI00388F0BD4